MRFNGSIWLIVLCIITTSCASNKPDKSGLERSEIVLNTMESMHENVQSLSSQLDKVDESLSELIRTGQPDIKNAFKDFSKNVNEFDANAKQILSNSGALQKQSNNYLGNWAEENNQFENSRLQDLSAERRQELSESHQEIFTAAGRAENQLKAFTTDVKEIRDYLDNDLTAAGINSVTSLSRDVLQDSDELHDSLEDMEYALEDAMAEMAHRGN